MVPETGAPISRASAASVSEQCVTKRVTNRDGRGTLPQIVPLPQWTLPQGTLPQMSTAEVRRTLPQTAEVSIAQMSLRKCPLRKCSWQNGHVDRTPCVCMLTGHYVCTSPALHVCMSVCLLNAFEQYRTVSCSRKTSTFFGLASVSALLLLGSASAPSSVVSHCEKLWSRSCS